ncbi:LIRP-like isoform X2 [Tachypleus tridentatus]
MNLQFIFTICVAAGFAQGLPNYSGLQTRSLKLCGAHLTEALLLVCHRPFKKTGNDLPTENFGSGPRLVLGKRLLDMRKTLSLLGIRDDFYQKTRGIADECCRKGCNIMELALYCGNETFEQL